MAGKGSQVLSAQVLAENRWLSGTSSLKKRKRECQDATSSSDQVNSNLESVNENPSTAQTQKRTHTLKATSLPIASGYNNTLFEQWYKPISSDLEEATSGEDAYSLASDEEDLDDDEWDAEVSSEWGNQGLSLWDLLGDGFEIEAANVADGKKVTEADMSLLRAYTLKVEEHLTDKVFDRFRFAFKESNLNSVKSSKHRIAFLSGFEPVRYDCCTNSCVCYTGVYADRNTCPKCNEPRYNTCGKPRKQFTYIPLIPRLRAAAANPTYASRMQYRSQGHTHIPDQITDIFDGHHYCQLKNQQITINDQSLPAWYFRDPRDIALGLSTDGFGPFKRRTQTAWPIVMFNYNLPPDDRFHDDEVIAMGDIPGPKKPWDIDSFLYPLIQELIQLMIGVSAFDALTKTLFLLRAFLIVVFGDIPAVSMLMKMKGHNAICPCRMCSIIGVRSLTPRATTHYVPLDRRKHPAKPNPPAYSADSLPLRTHHSFICQAREVQFATTDAMRKHLSQRYGIKGIPLLSSLGSMSFPLSFPFDFMHLIWENLIPNLIALWTGNFKDLDHTNEPYVLELSVWDAIGVASSAASDTLPSAFGARVPNIAQQYSLLTAETTSIWTLYLAPTLLLGRFKSPMYYKHFIELVRLLNQCLDYGISHHDLAKLRTGFNNWVVEYER